MQNLRCASFSVPQFEQITNKPPLYVAGSMRVMAEPPKEKIGLR